MGVPDQVTYADPLGEYDFAIPNRVQETNESLLPGYSPEHLVYGGSLGPHIVEIRGSHLVADDVRVRMGAVFDPSSVLTNKSESFFTV